MVPWLYPQSDNIPSPPVPSHSRSPVTSHTVLYGMFTHFLKLSQSARPAKPGAAKWRKKKAEGESAQTEEPQSRHRNTETTGTPAPGATLLGECSVLLCAQHRDHPWVKVNIRYRQNRGTVSWPIQLPRARCGDPPTTGPSPHPPRAERGRAMLLRRVLGGRSPWSYRAWPPAPNAAISRATCTVGREWAEMQAPPGPLWSMMLKRQL